MKYEFKDYEGEPPVVGPFAQLVIIFGIITLIIYIFAFRN